jgi:hypothetical protein
MDHGEETIEDAGVLAQIRQQARTVWVKSAVWGAALTLIVVLLPV